MLKTYKWVAYQVECESRIFNLIAHASSRSEAISLMKSTINITTHRGNLERFMNEEIPQESTSSFENSFFWISEGNADATGRFTEGEHYTGYITHKV